MTPPRICSCPEPYAETEDFADQGGKTVVAVNAHTHPGCNVYHKGPTCTIPKEVAMSKENGKDPDGVEIVHGNPTRSATVIGLRVADAHTKEGKDGNPIGHLTIRGRAGALHKLVGQECEIQTAGNGRRVVAHVHEYRLTEGKKGGPNVTTLKVQGSPTLHDLGLVQVQVVSMQGELPGLDPEDAAPKGSKKRRRARGRDAAAGADWA